MSFLAHPRHIFYFWAKLDCLGRQMMIPTRTTESTEEGKSNMADSKHSDSQFRQPSKTPLFDQAHRSKAVLAKIISGLPDIMSGKPSMLLGTFWSHVGHISQFMTGNYFLSCRILSMHWTLLDKMSGMSVIFREDCKGQGHKVIKCP